MNTQETVLARVRQPLSQRQPTRFKRNELQNLARRKGFQLSRHKTNHIGWTYRITRLPFVGSTTRAYRSYDYCTTGNATAAERVFLHLTTKPHVPLALRRKARR